MRRITKSTAGHVGGPSSGYSKQVNGICPYFTRFPLQFPLHRLRTAQPGQWALDPFCGGGTSLFAARLRGLGAVGIDSNRTAVVIARAKQCSATADAVVNTATHMLAEAPLADVPTGAFWEQAYSPEVLRTLCRFRACFTKSADMSSTATVLCALLLGMLHGPQKAGTPTYLSNHLPADFAPEPDDAARQWTRQRLHPPACNVLELVQARAVRLLTRQPPPTPGVVHHGDSRTIDLIAERPRFDWLITSPPYYGLDSYHADQWLRNWLTGGPPHPQRNNHQQVSQRTPQGYVADLALVWRRCAKICRPGARFIVRIGNVPGVDAPHAVDLLKASLHQADTGWRITTCRAVPRPPSQPSPQNPFVPPAAWPENETEVYARFAP